MKQIKQILNWLGLYTKEQYNSLVKENKTLSQSNVSLRMEKNSSQIYINELLKRQKKLPFEFDYLIGLYKKAELNALSYKIINRVRNNSELRDLLDIWFKRAKNAKDTLNKKGKIYNEVEGKQSIDDNFNEKT